MRFLVFLSVVFGVTITFFVVFSGIDMGARTLNITDYSTRVLNLHRIGIQTLY